MLSGSLVVLLKFWFLLFFHVLWIINLFNCSWLNDLSFVFCKFVCLLNERSNFSEMPSLHVRPLTLLSTSLGCNNLCLPFSSSPRYKFFHLKLYLSLKWELTALSLVVLLHCLLEMLFRIIPRALHSSRHQVLIFSKSRCSSFPPTTNRLVLEEHHQ